MRIVKIKPVVSYIVIYHVPLTEVPPSILGIINPFNDIKTCCIWNA